MNIQSPFPPVYIVDGSRTPFLKARGRRGPFSALDLVVSTGQQLLARQPFKPTELGEVVLGCMMPSENEANIGRLAALRLGCGDKVPGWTVQRNCASGMQAIDSALLDIVQGRHDLVLAGGTEAMSRAPLLVDPRLVNLLADFSSAPNLIKKLKSLLQWRPDFLKPVVALICGLTDPIVSLNMGQTAEILAAEFKISREEMDRFSLESHQHLARAYQEGYLKEITTLYDQEGNYYQQDDGMRADTTIEKLAKLKPIFDPRFGLVTAGNSSQITDGSALVILASEKAVRDHKLPILGRILDVNWAALDPARMGLGPVMASTPLLIKHQLQLSDIDYWEINEAFAVQVLACLAAWQDAKFCEEHFGLKQAMGALDRSRLNVDGGAIACGHPVGASGARIVLHLLEVLKRNKARLGIASICIGGGQGGAILVEAKQ